MFVTCFWLLPTEVCSPLPDPSGPHGCREGRDACWTFGESVVPCNYIIWSTGCRPASLHVQIHQNEKEPRSKHHFISYFDPEPSAMKCFCRHSCKSRGAEFRWLYAHFLLRLWADSDCWTSKTFLDFQILYNIHDPCDEVPHSILSKKHMPELDLLFHAIHRPKEYVHVACLVSVFLKRCYLFPTAGSWIQLNL